MPSTEPSNRLLLCLCLLHLLVSASCQLRPNRLKEPDWAQAHIRLHGMDLLTPIAAMNGRTRPMHLQNLVVDWRFPILHGNGTQFIPPTDYDCSFNCNKEQEYEWVACMLWTQEREQKEKCPNFTDPGEDFKIPLKETDCYVPCIYDARLSARGKRDCRISQLNTRAWDHCDAVGNYAGDFDAEQSLRGRYMKKVAISMVLNDDEIRKIIEEDAKWSRAESYNHAKEWREKNCPSCEPTEEKLPGEKLTREQQAAIPQYDVMRKKNGTGYVVIRTNPPHGRSQNEGTPMWKFDQWEKFIKTKSSEFHRGPDTIDGAAWVDLNMDRFEERVKEETIMKETNSEYWACIEILADLAIHPLFIAGTILAMYLIYKTLAAKEKAAEKIETQNEISPDYVLVKK